jgi:hypothetical protein
MKAEQKPIAWGKPALDLVGLPLMEFLNEEFFEVSAG